MPIENTAQGETLIQWDNESKNEPVSVAYIQMIPVRQITSNEKVKISLDHLYGAFTLTAEITIIFGKTNQWIY